MFIAFAVVFALFNLHYTYKCVLSLADAGTVDLWNLFALCLTFAAFVMAMSRVTNYFDILFRS